MTGAGWIAMMLAATAPVAPVPPADDAGWPCETEPKPVLAPGDYWPAAALTPARAWPSDPAIVALAGDVSRRSVEEDAATARLRTFASHASPVDRARLAAALVETVDGERRTILAGIRRFNVRQAQIARRIEQGYTAIDAPAATLTPQRRAELEEQAEWDQRIFEDRQRMLPIICRQPAVLETRLASLVAILRGTGK